MIPTGNTDVLDAALGVLKEFGERNAARGRFIALYLGLRRMRRLNRIAELGAGNPTPASEIESFLDDLFTKTNRPPPFVVLTAPFAQSDSPTAPWSTRTGEVAPGHKYATNTWRNNFGIQKGIGCPAEPGTINQLLVLPQLRLACPHLNVDSEGRKLCGLAGTFYRGDEHSIWLRSIGGGYEVVNLDLPAAYRDYLFPSGNRIAIFDLIAALYCVAPSQVYPVRQFVGIPEFADDFGFQLEAVQKIFDCDPDSRGNAVVLAAVTGAVAVPAAQPTVPAEPPPATVEGPFPLPAEPAAAILNTGVGAEVKVARDLARHGWRVEYWGSRRGVGFDLVATRAEAALRIEVKSSLGFCTPELTPEEWNAAQESGEDYVLAVVDFYGSTEQRIYYLRNPAANLSPVERTVMLYRLPRAEVLPLSTSAEFL